MHNPLDPKSRIFNGFIILFIVLSVISIPLHFLPTDPEVKNYLKLFDRITVTLFTLEYGLRIWSARDRSHYLLSWWGLVDLVAVLPFYIVTLFPLFSGIETLLFLRVLRILKFSRLYGHEEEILKHHHDNRHGSFQPIEGEKIERIIQKHPIVFFGGMIVSMILLAGALFIMGLFNFNLFSLIVGGIAIFFGVLFLVKSWIDYHYDVIYITNHRLILQDRDLFGAVTNDISYDAITNVIPDNVGFWHWMLSSGHIIIETPNRDGTLHFNYVQNPQDVVGHITSNRQKQRARKAKFEEKLSNMDEPKIHNVIES